MNRFGWFKKFAWAFVLLATSTLAQAQIDKAADTLDSRIRVFLSGASFGTTNKHDADFIVALVNRDIVTNQEVKQRMQQVLDALHSSEKASSDHMQEALYRAFDELVLERLQMQLARDIGISADEKVLDGAIQAIAKQNQFSVDQLRKRLVDDGVAYEDFRERVRSQLLLQRVRDRFLDPRPNVSNDEVEAETQRLQVRMLPPIVELNLAHIVIPVAEGAGIEVEKSKYNLALAIAEKARKGVDFSLLAQEIGASSTASEAKGMGLKEQDSYPALFVDAVRGVSVGGVSQPVKSGAGYHVVKLLEKKEVMAPIVLLNETRPRHILLRATTPDAIAKAQAQLALLREKIQRRDITFAEAAKTVSQDASASAGGDLGWTGPTQFVSEFENVMNRLPIGKISEPIVSRFGVHLIEVLERRDIQIPSTQLRERIVETRREAKVEENFKNWSQELRSRAYIELREAPQL